MVEKKFNEVTEDFIEAMDYYSVKQLSTLEASVVELDLFQRNYMLRAFVFAIMTFALVAIQLLQNTDDGTQFFMIGVIILSGILCAYCAYLGLDYGVQLNQKLDSLNISKGLYLDSIRKSFFDMPSELDSIFADLNNHHVYDPVVCGEMKIKIKNKQFSDKEIEDLALALRTAKLKLSVVPSTTVSIEEQRKKMSGESE